MKHPTFSESEMSSARGLPLASFLVLATALGCAGVKPSSQSSGQGGSSPTGAGNNTGQNQPPPCVGKCTDFQADPLVEPGAPANVTGMFGSTSGAAPCVTEPEDNSLFPNNWLRPRVRVAGAAALKIVFHADVEANDLVVYAGGDSWALPKDVWRNLAAHVRDEQVTVTVQTPGSAPATVHFTVAPVGASGSMVFWAADPSQVDRRGVELLPIADVVNSSELRGFAVGDESTISALRIDQVVQPTFQQDGSNTRQAHCIGCHVGTPDGAYVAFVDAWPWSAAFAGVKDMITGQALPNYAGATCTGTCTGTKTFVQYPWAGPFAFSGQHWSTGDKIAVVASQMQTPSMPWSTDNWRPGRLAWVDVESTVTTMVNGQTFPLEGAAFGYITRTGDSRAAAFPTWSHDGTRIVYCSTACPQPGQTNGCGMQDGRLNIGATDLFSVPYANKAGGEATPVAGASQPGVEEYYPAFSPDDELLIFNTVPSGQSMYANRNAELSVVSSTGGTAVRLAANDPPTCAGKPSPGINNHWAKWSPSVGSAGGRTYYFAIFSSNRYGLPTGTSQYSNPPRPIEISQLYITAILRDEQGIRTYPAIYLWNQPQTSINTTPAWERFLLPPVL